ncbi:hypothetical protein Z946_1514 [Sulfitobacter noctilucicola]|nr:hypothetical protein Z946_1514 [Sulfitobacter noctilucicola]
MSFSLPEPWHSYKDAWPVCERLLSGQQSRKHNKLADIQIG